MFIILSYINLFLLLTISICHMVLAIVYYDKCPTSPFLSITLIIIGIIGISLSIIALIIHRFDAYDGSNKRNLLLTYILFIYLFGSRIMMTILTFRLISQSYDEYQCAPVLYWTSTLLTIVSDSIIVINCCVLMNLILLQITHNKYQNPMNRRSCTI